MNTKPITYLEIFNDQKNGETIERIEIPIIQRDYAQGRESKEIERIRKQFLKVLFNSLTEVSAPVKLDFVYGDISDHKLIPLDGQQRLTTLFLLHWYIAKHEKIADAECAFLYTFSYKTRFSSQHFCNRLANCTPNFDLSKLSDWITDQSWFMYSWFRDPTIKSMLLVIDEIHLLFNNTSGLWRKLRSIEGPYISFYFLPLKDMGLTDNLYIKMNSRGKPLTDFEHFKAEFGKTIKDVSYELHNEFAKKADIDWVDLLWKYRGDDNIIDVEFLRYYRFVTEMICHQEGLEILENDFDLSASVYGIKNPNAAKNLRYLFDAFDCWKRLQNIDVFFNDIYSQDSYEINKVCLYSSSVNLFLDCCNYYGKTIDRRRLFTLSSTLLLYAVLQYLINQEKISQEQFIERIRIIRNLVLNSSDEIRIDRMRALLNDIKSVIVEGAINLNTLGLNETQKKEEIEKISWRKNNPDLITEINQLEDHFLLQGSVSIIGFEDPQLFKTRATSFKILFVQGCDYIRISRAMLTIGDYSQLATWKFLFGNSNNSTWRELFTISKQRKNYDQTRTVLLQLLDNLKSDDSNQLNNIIRSYLMKKDTSKDWRFYFVKYPKMRSGWSGVYWWKRDGDRIKDNQYEIIMMNTAFSTTGRHWDPFLYVLYTDESLSGLFYLEEYGHPLVHIKTNQRIRCANSCWEIYDVNDLPLKSIDIPQQNGIDSEDRIDFFKQNILPTLK
jgi:hypothetical protein